MNAIAAGNRRHWAVGAASGALALAALVIGSVWGKLATTAIDPRIIAWSSGVGVIVFGGLATSRLARAMSHELAFRSMAAAGGAVRIGTGAVGILFVILATLTVLHVDIDKLLVGVGLAGVVLGIAAQQSLGNIFAGIVLVTVRPFRIGDHIRVRSGALGGIFDAWVREMSLTYVTLQTEDGDLKVPNAAMLAAAVGPVPPPAARAPLAHPAPGATSGSSERPGAPDALDEAPEAQRP